VSSLTFSDWVWYTVSPHYEYDRGQLAVTESI